MALGATEAELGELLKMHPSSARKHRLKVLGAVEAVVKARRRNRRAPIDDAPLPAVVDGEAQIGPEASLAQIQRWISRIEQRAREAEVECDDDAYATYARLIVSLLEAQRKLTPDPVQDPNDAPDMVRLGKEVVERFDEMVRKVGT